MTPLIAMAVAAAGLLVAAVRVALTLAGHPDLPWLDTACLALWAAALGLAFRWLHTLRRR